MLPCHRILIAIRNQVKSTSRRSAVHRHHTVRTNILFSLCDNSYYFTVILIHISHIDDPKVQRYLEQSKKHSGFATEGREQVLEHFNVTT